MLDANDYANPYGVSPAERCLTPQHWVAPSSLDAAITAPLGKASTELHVRVDHGRWIVQCPDPACGDAQLAAPSDRRYMCVGCGNRSADGVWRPVVWPKDHAAIGNLLDLRPTNLANWLPGETLEQIQEENRMLKQAIDLKSGPAPDLGGHVHKWGKPDREKLRTCRVSECGLVLPADVIAGGKAA